MTIEKRYAFTSSEGMEKCKTRRQFNSQFTAYFMYRDVPLKNWIICIDSTYLRKGHTQAGF